MGRHEFPEMPPIVNSRGFHNVCVWGPMRLSLHRFPFYYNKSFWFISVNIVRCWAFYTIIREIFEIIHAHRGLSEQELSPAVLSGRLCLRGFDTVRRPDCQHRKVTLASPGDSEGLPASHGAHSHPE